MTLFTRPWDENPRKTVVKIEGEDEEDVLFEYDRSILFPVTRWLQEHRGEKISHDLYEEFTILTTDIQGEFFEEYEYSDESYDAATKLLDTVDNMMLALWDMRAELRPWMITTACKILVGTHRTDMGLPEPQMHAFDREMEYRGGPNEVEKAFANLDHALLKDGDDVPFPEVTKDDNG